MLSGLVEEGEMAQEELGGRGKQSFCGSYVTQMWALLNEKPGRGFSFMLPEWAPYKGQEPTVESVISSVQLLKEETLVTHLRRCSSCLKEIADKPFPMLCGSISDAHVKMPGEEMSQTPASPRVQVLPVYSTANPIRPSLSVVQLARPVLLTP